METGCDTCTHSTRGMVQPELPPRNRSSFHLTIRHVRGNGPRTSPIYRLMCPFVLLITASCIIGVQAQELVPNGNFEQYSACPDYMSQIDRANGWSRPTEGTSDYFNACLGVPFSESVPDNEFGDQPAHSGNGYAGFYCFYSADGSDVPGDDDHEYVSHALETPLVPGETYTVEFFISLAEVSKYAVNDIGALLSVQKPHRDDEFAITATPQVMNTSLDMLNDKDGWTRIHGCFMADSAYAYVTIGNFHEGPAIVYEEVPTDFPLTYYSYYYVDDVSIQHLARPELGPDLSICEPTTISIQDPVPGAEYLWSTGETGPNITVDTTGTYSVQFVDEDCPLSDTIEVQTGEPVTFTLPTDTLVDFCLSSRFLLDARPQPPYAHVVWSTGDTTAAILVEAASTYVIHASATGHCDASTAITITDSCKTPVYAPNAFTPNGDGINDEWRPLWSTDPGATIQWSVFDRWGHVLFSSTNADDAWDGTDAGTPVANGSYVWLGHAHDPAMAEVRGLTGHVVLLR